MSRIRQWFAADDEVLRANYGAMPSPDLVALLGGRFSASAIRRRASVLGLVGIPKHLRSAWQTTSRRKGAGYGQNSKERYERYCFIRR